MALPPAPDDAARDYAEFQQNHIKTLDDEIATKETYLEELHERKRQLLQDIQELKRLKTELHQELPMGHSCAAVVPAPMRRTMSMLDDAEAFCGSPGIGEDEAPHGNDEFGNAWLDGPEEMAEEETMADADES